MNAERHRARLGIEYAADLASLARDPAAALASLEGAEIEVLAELTSTGLEELNALVPELRDVAGRVEGELRFGGTVELAGRLDDSYITEGGFAEIPGYGVVNAYAEWRPEDYQNVVVRLGVDNLFDKTYFERTSYAQFARREVYPVYAPGRTVTLGVSMDF